MFGFIKGLAKATVNTALTPLDVVKDVVPGAGGYVDGNDSHVGRRVEKIERNVKRAIRDLEEDLD